MCMTAFEIPFQRDERLQRCGVKRQNHVLWTKTAFKIHETQLFKAPALYYRDFRLRRRKLRVRASCRSAQAAGLLLWSAAV